jgi:hypothetical protein
MHSTQDISDATAIVFNELTRLGVEMERCGIGIFNNPPVMEIWYTPLSPKDKKVVEVITGSLNIDIHPLLRGSYEAWKSKEDFFIYELKGAEVKKYYQLLEKDPGYHFPKISSYSQTQILNTAYFMEGSIFVYTREPLPEEHKEIIRRFTKVFSLTYRRYQDLKHAEAQAREAQIEASLERVRAKALAMHSTKDISEATAIVFDELTRLGIEMERCGIGLMNNPPIMEIWSTPLSPKNKRVVDVVTGSLSLKVHPMLRKSYDAWKKKEDFFSYELKGAEVKKYYELIGKEPKYHLPSKSKYPKQQILNSSNFKEGCLFVYTQKPLPEENKKAAFLKVA